MGSRSVESNSPPQGWQDGHAALSSSKFFDRLLDDVAEKKRFSSSAKWQTDLWGPGSLQIGWSDVIVIYGHNSQYDLHVVGHDVVLREFNRWRFVTLFNPLKGISAQDRYRLIQPHAFAVYKLLRQA